MSHGRQKPPEGVTGREHERDDCVHYAECLYEAAHGGPGGRRRRGGLSCLPCLGCPKYEPQKPAHADPWWNRWG